MFKMWIFSPWVRAQDDELDDGSPNGPDDDPEDEPGKNTPVEINV